MKPEQIVQIVVAVTTMIIAIVEASSRNCDKKS